MTDPSGPDHASSGVTHMIPVQNGVPTMALSTTTEEVESSQGEFSMWSRTSTISIPEGFYYSPP